MTDRRMDGAGVEQVGTRMGMGTGTGCIHNIPITFIKKGSLVFHRLRGKRL